jgi:hypothetical protein
LIFRALARLRHELRLRRKRSVLRAKLKRRWEKQLQRKAGRKRVNPDMRRRAAILRLEDSSSPLELAALAAKLDFLNPEARRAFEELPVAQLLTREQPTGYLRTEIASSVTLYSDPNFPPVGKSLLLAFGAAGGGLSMGTTMFLQLVPSEKFDVVLLRDRSSKHYLAGLGDYADDFPSLVDRLVKDFHSQRYARVVCYGTSIGGVPALRCGLLLGGVRAISISGRFPWHIGRLLDGTGRAMPAFDLLCACKTSQPTDFVCVYGEDSKLDSAAVDHVERMFPVLRRPISGTADHNVLYELWKRGSLQAFHQELFST